MAKRQLVTEARVLEAAAAGRTTLEVLAGALITPLAHDTARARGVAFATRAEQPPTATAATDLSRRRLALGADHGGYALKEALKPFVAELGWRVLDLGTDSEAPCDYPDFAFAVARALHLGQADAGLMIDGAGMGSAIVCNKVPGVRAAPAYNAFTAWNARAHNDANVLTLGSRSLGIEVCKHLVRTFLTTDFEGGRHAARIGKVADVEARFLPTRLAP